MNFTAATSGSTAASNWIGPSMGTYSGSSTRVERYHAAKNVGRQQFGLFRGLAHGVDERAGVRVARRVAEHRDPRLDAERGRRARGGASLFDGLRGDATELALKGLLLDLTKVGLLGGGLVDLAALLLALVLVARARARHAAVREHREPDLRRRQRDALRSHNFICRILYSRIIWLTIFSVSS